MKKYCAVPLTSIYLCLVVNGYMYVCGTKWCSSGLQENINSYNKTHSDCDHDDYIDCCGNKRLSQSLIPLYKVLLQVALLKSKRERYI